MDFEVTRLTVGSFQENSWFLTQQETKTGIFIDPGDEPEKLIQLVEESDTQPVAILNTHAHLDHIGGVKILQDRYNLPFYLHSADEFLVERYPEFAQIFGVRMNGIPNVTHYVDKLTDTNNLITIEDIEVQVISTPGHTPGGVSYLVSDELFVGDTLFAGSIGRTDLPGGDYETLMQSIVNQLLALQNETLVHSGHGPDTTIGRERETNPFIQDWLRTH